VVVRALTGWADEVVVLAAWSLAAEHHTLVGGDAVGIAHAGARAHLPAAGLEHGAGLTESQAAEEGDYNHQDDGPVVEQTSEERHGGEWGFGEAEK